MARQKTKVVDAVLNGNSTKRRRSLLNFNSFI